MWGFTNKRDRDFRRRGVEIAKGSHIGAGCRIGDYTRINAPSHLSNCSIGAYCAIGGRLVVRDRTHETRFLNMQGKAQREVIGSDLQVSRLTRGETRIGNACWIGDSVIVLPGVTIGNGAVIGAGSVVTRDVPDYAIAAGNPARVLRRRFSEDKIALLQGLNWWDWPHDKLRRNRGFFELDIDACTPEALRAAIAAVT